MHRLRRYADVLRAPHVTPLLLASMLARLPYGVYALAAILYLAEARGSYAVAGLVDGAFGLGAAAGAPWQSRLIDRLGQRRVLVVAAVVDVAATGLLIALTETDAPTVTLVACGLVGGVAVPNVGGALRAMWAGLLRGREPLLPTAFAIDSVALETLFTAGPLLAAGIIAVASPAAALVISAACSLTGTLAFIAQRPSRAWRPDPDAGARGRLGALSSSGVRTLAFAALPVGFCFGAVEIALPGFAESHGQRELAGVLLATWSVGSLLGGLVYGAITWRRPTSSVYVWLSALLPLGFLPALARALHPFDGDPDHHRRSPDRTPGRGVQPAHRQRRPTRRGHRGVRVAGDSDARRLRAGHGDRRRAGRARGLGVVLRRRRSDRAPGLRRRAALPRHVDAGGCSCRIVTMTDEMSYNPRVKRFGHADPVLPPQPEADQTLATLLRGPATAPALHVPDGLRLDFGGLAEAVGEMAGVLRAAGVTRGDRVVLVVPDGPVLLQTLLAVVTLGAAAAPLNPAYTHDEYVFFMEDLSPRLALLAPGEATAARAASSVGVGVGELLVEDGRAARRPDRRPGRAHGAGLRARAAGRRRPACSTPAAPPAAPSRSRSRTAT